MATAVFWNGVEHSKYPINSLFVFVFVVLQWLVGSEHACYCCKHLVDTVAVVVSISVIVYYCLLLFLLSLLTWHGWQTFKYTVYSLVRKLVNSLS